MTGDTYSVSGAPQREESAVVQLAVDIYEIVSTLPNSVIDCAHASTVGDVAVDDQTVFAELYVRGHIPRVHDIAINSQRAPTVHINEPRIVQVAANGRLIAKIEGAVEDKLPTDLVGQPASYVYCVAGAKTVNVSSQGTGVAGVAIDLQNASMFHVNRPGIVQVATDRRHIAGAVEDNLPTHLVGQLAGDHNRVPTRAEATGGYRPGIIDPAINGERRGAAHINGPAVDHAPEGSCIAMTVQQELAAVSQLAGDIHYMTARLEPGLQESGVVRVAIDLEIPGGLEYNASPVDERARGDGAEAAIGAGAKIAGLAYRQRSRNVQVVG